MSNKEKIIELLNNSELTVKEIADKIDISESDTRVYLKRIKDQNNIKLKVIGTKNKYKIYTIEQNGNIDTEILKKMIPKFIEREITLDNTTEIEDKRIMELIQKCQ